MNVVLKRKDAFWLAWALFRMATGTSHVGLVLKDGRVIELNGAGVLKEKGLL